MAILEEYDWMLINELSFKIHTTSDTKEMRQTVLTCLNQIISFDMASFYLLSDAGPDFNYSDPVFYCFSDLDLQIYKNCGEQIDFTKWLFYNRKNAAYKESDLRSPDKLKDTEIYQQCYLPLYCALPWLHAATNPPLRIPTILLRAAARPLPPM